MGTGEWLNAQNVSCESSVAPAKAISLTIGHIGACHRFTNFRSHDQLGLSVWLQHPSQGRSAAPKTGRFLGAVVTLFIAVQTLTVQDELQTTALSSCMTSYDAICRNTMLLHECLEALEASLAGKMSSKCSAL